MYRAEISELKGGAYYSDKLSTYTIYSLVNLDNCKRYIGRTRNPKERIKQHFVDIRRHKHSNKLLNEESRCRFSFEILEEGIPFIERTNKERTYILLHRTYDEGFGYNVNDPCIKRFVEEKKDAKSISNKTGRNE